MQGLHVKIDYLLTFIQFRQINLNEILLSESAIKSTTKLSSDKKEPKDPQSCVLYFNDICNVLLSVLIIFSRFLN